MIRLGEYFSQRYTATFRDSDVMEKPATSATTDGPTWQHDFTLTEIRQTDAVRPFRLGHHRPAE